MQVAFGRWADSLLGKRGGMFGREKTLYLDNGCSDDRRSAS
jgi:hypothetical protein